MRMKNGRKKCPSSPVSWKVRHQRFLPSKFSAIHLQNGFYYHHHQSIRMMLPVKIIIKWLQAEKIVCTTNPGSSYFQIRVGLWPRPPPICCSTMQCVCCSTMQVFVTWLCCALYLCAFDEKTAIFLATLSFFYITFVQNYSYRRRKSYSCSHYMRHIKAQYGHYFNFANRSNMPLYTLPVWAIEHFLRILH